MFVVTQKPFKNRSPAPSGVCLQVTRKRNTGTAVNSRFASAVRQGRGQRQIKGDPLCAGAGPAASSIRGPPQNASRPATGGASPVSPGSAQQSPVGSWTTRSSEHPLSAETPPGPQEERGRSQNSPKTLISPERYRSSIDLCLEKLGIRYFSHPRYQRRPQSEFKRHREKVF